MLLPPCAFDARVLARDPWPRRDGRAKHRSNIYPRGGHSWVRWVAPRGRNPRIKRTYVEMGEITPSRGRIANPTPDFHFSHVLQS